VGAWPTQAPLRIATGSNCSKFVRSRAHIQVNLIVQFVQQGIIDRFGRDPRRLQLLFLSQGFSNGPSPPLGAHVQRPSMGHEQKQRPKLGIFFDKQEATSVESLLKRATTHEGLKTTVLSDTDMSCWLIPQSGGDQTGNSHSKFSKTCSVISSVEHINWVRPCLLSNFCTDHCKAYLKRNALR